jgi:DNA-binding NarL/FixJ family response regulator
MYRTGKDRILAQPERQTIEEVAVEIALNHIVSRLEQSVSIRTPARPAKNVLTARETEVLRLLADGFTTKAAAIHLGVSFKTIACHRSRILQKLDVGSIVLAVRWAIREGIVEI